MTTDSAYPIRLGAVNDFSLFLSISPAVKEFRFHPEYLQRPFFSYFVGTNLIWIIVSVLCCHLAANFNLS